MAGNTTKQILKDKDIREPLFFFLESRYGKIRILEEKVTGRSRADVVMITPSVLYGIEIKSDADTYVRLEAQVRYYDLYYDRNIVVVGSSHAAHIREHVPEWWGIISVELIDGEPDFYVIREADRNPKTDAARKITILWRTELNRLLLANRLPAYRGKSKRFVQQKLLAMVPDEILWRDVTEELFERDYNTIEAEIEAYRRRKKRPESKTGMLRM